MTWTTHAWIDEDAANEAPAWLQPVIASVRGVCVDELTTAIPMPGVGRHSAVLMLFGETDGEPDVLIIRRSQSMRSHAGQPAFPGGAVDEGDESAIAAALREAYEEAGVEASSVSIIGCLPDLWVSVSNYVVTPVLAWWREPHLVEPNDRDEVESVHRIAMKELIEPAHRVQVRHPSGYVGAGFLIDDILIWGFTAGILASVIDRVGWAKPWDTTRMVDIT
jgi:8-oxo-dGTP pyrophosphatase MutT (NUDIX family)